LPLLPDGSPSRRRGASRPAPRRPERGPTQYSDRLLAAPAAWGEPPAGDPKKVEEPKPKDDPRPAVGDDLKPSAQAFIGLLEKGEYDKAVERFDDTMKQALPPDKLRAVWEGLQAQVGKFSKTTGADQQVEGGYRVVFVKCEFEKTALEAKVVHDSGGKIAGLFFLPPRPEAAGNRVPPYARPDRVTETGIAVGPPAGGGLGPEAGSLPGLIVVPRGPGPFPGLVLAHGSGPLDRDETIGPNRPFRDLAWGLGSRGIAVLRYDKRSHALPATLLAAGDRLTLRQEAVADLLAAVARLRATPGINPERIFVLGHSLGGVAAVRAGKDDGSIAGLVLMAAPGRPLEDHIPEQLAYIFGLDGTLSEDDLVRLDEARRQVGRVKGLAADPADAAPGGNAAPPAAADLPFGIPAAYWDDLARNPATRLVRDLHMPILVLRGGRDYQVTADDLDVWRGTLEGSPLATLRTYPALNHLFIEGSGRSTPEEYFRPGHVAAAVIEDLAAWILSRPDAPRSAAGEPRGRVSGTA
jgi:hypothetical protein